MKKYLRIILEVLLAMLLVGAAAMAYWNYAGKKHISYELAEVTEQVDEAKEALEKAEEEMKELKEKLKKRKKSKENNRLKSLFARKPNQ